MNKKKIFDKKMGEPLLQIDKLCELCKILDPGWNKLKCKSGAEYKWKHDDHCIAVKVGKNIVYLELEALRVFYKKLNRLNQQEQRFLEKEFTCDCGNQMKVVFVGIEPLKKISCDKCKRNIFSI